MVLRGLVFLLCLFILFVSAGDVLGVCLDQPEADLNGDCVVDACDVSLMVGDWLEGDYTLVLDEPNFPGLAAHWKLDASDPCAIAVDWSGNGHTGTLYNGPVWRPEVGKIDGALSFDEVDDYVRIGDFDYTNASDEFSVSFWFKISDVAGSVYQYMFSHGNYATNNSLNVYFSEASEGAGGEEVRTNITLNDGTSWQGVTSPIFADGQWHLYTITVSAADGAEIYIDSNSVLTNPAIKGASLNPSTDIYLGGRCDLNVDRFYGNPSSDDGLLDDVRIYSRALSESEVTILAGGQGEVYFPLTSAANLYDGEPVNERRVNFRDYAILAAGWLDEGQAAPENECENWQVLHPEWIFCDDFETEQNLNVNYHDYSTNGMFVSTNGAFRGTYSLEQYYTAGQVNAGWVGRFIGDNPNLSQPGPKYDEIYYRWYHKFAEGFVGLPPKMARSRIQLPGDWTGYAGMYQWIDNGLLCAEVHTYYPVDRWMPIAYSTLDYSEPANIGRWICIEVRLKLNSPSQSNGEIQYWADGEEVLHRTGVDICGDFDDYGINLVQLDCYWNGGSPVAQSRFYDNFVISTGPIGTLQE
ncbi:MAG: LamG domain-containing protein [Planctomycetota bacterium]|jgi:hypothetical protein